MSVLSDFGEIGGLVKPVIAVNQLKNREFDIKDQNLLNLATTLPVGDFISVGGDKVIIVRTPEETAAPVGKIGTAFTPENLKQEPRSAVAKQFTPSFQITEEEMLLGYITEEHVDAKINSLGLRIDIAKNSLALELLNETETEVAIDGLSYKELVVKGVPLIGAGKGTFLVVGQEGYGQLAADKNFIPAGAEEQKNGVIGRIAGLQVMITNEIEGNDAAYITIDKPIYEMPKQHLEVWVDENNFDTRTLRVGAVESNAYILAHDERAVVKLNIGEAKPEPETKTKAAPAKAKTETK